MAAHQIDPQNWRCVHCGYSELDLANALGVSRDECPDAPESSEIAPPWTRDQLLAELRRCVAAVAYDRGHELLHEVERRLILDSEIAARLEAYSDSINLGEGWLRITDAGARVERVHPRRVVLRE